eukprot:321526-Chlamydomonas_euryale.AAC.3
MQCRRVLTCKKQLSAVSSGAACHRGVKLAEEIYIRTCSGIKLKTAHKLQSGHGHVMSASGLLMRKRQPSIHASWLQQDDHYLWHYLHGADTKETLFSTCCVMFASMPQPLPRSYVQTPLQLASQLRNNDCNGTPHIFATGSRGESKRV